MGICKKKIGLMIKKKCDHSELISIGVDAGYLIERCIECNQLVRSKIDWEESNV